MFSAKTVWGSILIEDLYVFGVMGRRLAKGFLFSQYAFKANQYLKLIYPWMFYSQMVSFSLRFA